ncbi:hypothetical protein M413DRAFT_440533 [Hebeloma cylindrosporum]|uniref:Uncharacterized protein n=1 Tax=Hebeloma cylindrosporum TaxID=76867 RepID=A0A0C3CST8_HEBCY|nr:hypothetical protein M413DRAFT_440533 [Hebeloma cylindrosporum h7]
MFTKLKELIQRAGGRGHEPVVPPPVYYRQPISIQTRLTKLELQVDILFEPPHSAWTLSLLRNSQVASLTISHSPNRDIFHKSLFPLAFDSIGATLRDLKLDILYPASLTALVESLHLLPSLETLVLGLASCDESPPAPPENPTYLHLANLISFTGSVEQAAYLFGHTTSCEKLACINLIIDLYYEPPKNLYPGMAERFTVLNSTLSRLGINPTLALCISTEGQPPGVPIFFPLTDQSHYSTAFSRVSSLTLDVPIANPENVELWVHQEVLDWLVTFRAVNALTVILRKNSPISRPQNGIINEECQARLISGIVSAHPNVVCNIIDLPPNQHHFHWSNARDEFSRAVAYGLPPIMSHRQRLVASCVCDHF